MSTFAVLVIDMQKAYFEAGDLKGRERSLVSASNLLLDAALENEIAVFNVITLHERDRSTWTLNMLDDNEGYLFVGDDGAGQIAGLKLDGSTKMTKTRDSAFFQTPLAMHLEAASVDTLILLGVSTHSCIYQTASDAYASNFRVLIAEEAVSSHDQRRHRPALEMLQQEYRQSVLSTGEILNIMNVNNSHKVE